MTTIKNEPVSQEALLDPLVVGSMYTKSAAVLVKAIPIAKQLYAPPWFYDQKVDPSISFEGPFTRNADTMTNNGKKGAIELFLKKVLDAIEI
jgi:hypothetical protein